MRAGLVWRLPGCNAECTHLDHFEDHNDVFLIMHNDGVWFMYNMLHPNVCKLDSCTSHADASSIARVN